MNRDIYIYILYISLIYHSIIVRIIFRTLSSKKDSLNTTLKHLVSSLRGGQRSWKHISPRILTQRTTSSPGDGGSKQSEGFKFQHEDLLEIVLEDLLQIIQIHSLLQTKKKGEKKVAGGVQFRQKNVWKWILRSSLGVLCLTYIDMK